MPRTAHHSRLLRRFASAAACAVIAALASIALPTGASADPVPPGDPTPTTVAPPTTSTPTTAPPTTTGSVPGSTVAEPTTTIPTTPTGPTTTVTPVGPDGTLPSSMGRAEPSPVIPTRDANPVFYAARTLDALGVEVDKADKAVADALAASAAADERVAGAARARSHADSVDKDAIRAVAVAKLGVKRAAMRAYTGYGGEDAAPLVPGAPVTASRNGAYRTYVEATTEEAIARLKRARSAQQRTHAALEVATHDLQAADAARDDATKHLADTRDRAAEIHRKLQAEQRALAAALSSSPDFSPGTFELLPQVAAAGAILVPSPAGQIVVPPGTDPRIVAVLSFVVAQIGKPYVWGATGPSTYDCSGLMLRAFLSVGVQLPRVSQAQQATFTPVAPADARPGDLVFFGTPAYHVGMYIGGGLMIDAPFTGALVRIDRVWPTGFSGFGRVLPLVPVPPTTVP